MNIIFRVLPALLLLNGACSTSHKTASPETRPDGVISRIDDLNSRPSWLREQEAFRIEGGKVVSLGSTEIPGDHRVSAAYRIAENNAKAAIAGAIEQRLEFILQNAEEGTSIDTNQVRYIGAEATRLVTSSIRPGRRYWERVATTRDSGERVTIYKVFATVEMPEADFKKAIIDAINKQKGQPSISNEFAKRVDRQWDRFVEGE